jgi:putative transposase
VKVELIDAHKARFSVCFMCEQLGVSRSGCDAWKSRPESERRRSDRALAEVVSAARCDSRGTYGSPRVDAELHARRQRVIRKRVARVMDGHGLAVRRRRRFVTTTDYRHQQPMAPNILERRFTPGQPNSICVTDITYVATKQGWLYLAVVLDLLSHQGGGLVHEPEHRPTSGAWCAGHGPQRTSATTRATTHSDRGSQYASADYQQALLKASSAACHARATAGTTPLWRASSAP